MKWEYMVREFRVQDSANVSLLEEFLNETGRDGWELVNVAIAPAGQFTHLVYLKRIAPLSERIASDDFAPGSPTNGSTGFLPNWELRR
jgi:hypothetical protein